MIYIWVIGMIGFVIGLIAVASNPSPFYAALGLVLGAVFGCWMMVQFGISFLSLILLLIYLGGMLVVFAYSAFLAADPHPEAWGSWSVLVNVLLYVAGFFVGYWLSGVEVVIECSFDEYNENFGAVVGDLGGITVMYGPGGLFLIVSGWVLLLTLFVVLGVTRGLFCGSLRAV
uniref:NADH-ubiquinone oxidoreductase chain 6 n=1 Tax=Amphiuma means TaxID=8312 RepID=C9DHD2_AMPME|nr:NADH dehydrogenase subunit 6 [Amphiuma means]